MRKVKYKAWHIGEEKMCNVEILNFEKGAFLSDLIPEPNQLVELGGKLHEVIAPDTGRFCVFPEFRLLQYIGIDDEDGSEIYDGDLVLIRHWKSSDLFDYSRSFEVRWGNGQVVFVQSGHYLHIGSLVGKTTYKRVGNIYENP